MNSPSTCPHFSECSGCVVENVFRPPIWNEACLFFEKNGVHPEFIVDGFEGVRLKAKLAVRSGPVIGLFKKNTHDVIPIPNCLIHHPSINRAVVLIKQEMIRHNVTAYQENPPRGTLRYIQLFVERTTNRVQLTLILNHKHGVEPFYQSLMKHDLWHSIWLNQQSGSTNQILGEHWEHIYGELFLWQTLNQTRIPFHPGAFSQTHLPLFEKMLQSIESWVKPNEHVLELYAGVGAIGLSLQKKVKSITLVENNPFAHLSFQQTKAKIPYHLIDARDANLSGYDLIIVDPPRKGLDPTMIPKLDADRLIYVSCGFESFKRDAERLICLGWKLREAKGFLLFPGTNHVEILSLFEK